MTRQKDHHKKKNAVRIGALVLAGVMALSVILAALLSR